MKRLTYGLDNFEFELLKLYNRGSYPAEIEDSVRDIIAEVRRDGDKALVKFAKKFDHADLTPDRFLVTPEEVEESIASVCAEDRRAIDVALAHVMDFSRQRIPQKWEYNPRPGVTLGEKFEPLDRVGVYIPGGTASLVSTVIHTAGIARAAGVKEIVAVSPPNAEGKIAPAVLYAMKQAGVSEIYRLGGVYAIAALAYGTDTIDKVEKIVGPGNAYVTAAKKLVYGEVAIDMIAGPSEILIIADHNAPVELVAADVLSQAEHGSGLEQAVVISDSAEFLDKVESAVNEQKQRLPRQATVDKVLLNGTFLIEVPTMDMAAVIAGNYAPEHLEVMCASPREIAMKIKAAGAIFIAPCTPEQGGDFCAGPSHVLPTGGSARFFSGLTVEGFFRRTSLVQYTHDAIEPEIETIERIAALEGLMAHGLSGTRRRDSSGNGKQEL